MSSPSPSPLRALLLNPGAEGAAVSPPAPDSGAYALHRSMPGYRPSRLVDAPRTARHLGVGRLLVKVEDARFGLPSFKILGASWAVCRLLSREAGRPAPVPTFGALRELAAATGPWTLVAATDGNHGRAVAWMARRLGLAAHILVPADMAAARVQAIRGEGARVTHVDGSYDDAVAASAALAGPRHLVVSDTSWPGYADVPRWVSDGYATIFAELATQQPDGAWPTVAAVQIGVGALAAAAVRALRPWGVAVVGVEPADAACAMRAVAHGAPTLVAGPHRSIMVGLNCGLVSEIALPELRRGVRAFCAVDDAAAEEAMRRLHDDGIDAGETGAAGVAGLAALRDDRAAREVLGLGPAATVLALCTEGPTDPEGFARVVGAAQAAPA